MGLAASTQNGAHLPLPSSEHQNDSQWPKPKALNLPITLANKTTVHELGRVEPGKTLWHIAGGKKVFPFPAGYKASCEAYNTTATLTIEPEPGTSYKRFVITTANGETFSGSSPTTPFAKWGLSLGDRKLVLNGLQAYGFLDPQIQAALRQLGSQTGELDTYVKQVQPPLFSSGGDGAPATTQAAVGDWVTHFRERQPALEQLESLLPALPPLNLASATTPAAYEAQGAQPQLLSPAAEAQRMQSVTPSLHTWLELTGAGGHSASAQGGGGAGGQRAVQSITAQQGFMGLEDKQRSAFENIQSPSLAGPKQWLIPSESDLRALHAAHAAAAAAGGGAATRPGSRTTSRKRPSSSEGGKSCKGWTAFTAYGLEQRDIVRSQHPHATATEVEKLVGQRWASLSKNEKQRYAEYAAEVRKSSLGGGGGGAGSIEGVDLIRTTSDAGTVALLEERRLRPRKRRPRYGEYETEEEWGALPAGEQQQEQQEHGEHLLLEEEQPEGGRRRGQFGVDKSTIYKYYQDILPGGIVGEPGEERRKLPVTGKAKRRRPPTPSGSQARRAKRKGGDGGPKPRPLALAADEQDVLGLLADMRAEAIASESDDGPPGAVDAIGGAAVVDGSGGSGVQGNPDMDTVNHNNNHNDSKTPISVARAAASSKGINEDGSFVDVDLKNEDVDEEEVVGDSQ